MVHPVLLRPQLSVSLTFILPKALVQAQAMEQAALFSSGL